LGGIIRDRQDKTQRNLGATDIPTNRMAQSQKTETLIFVRPRLVQIRPTGRSGVVVPSKVPNIMGEVMSDEARVNKLLVGMGDGG
jgi:hypothetical protein